MSAELYLSRARLRTDAPISALHNLLVPKDESARISASHRLVWTLFGDVPERARDFLWRESEPGTFYLLSERAPQDHHGIFSLDEPKIFAPALAVGDRLAFALRANATVARSAGKGARGKPCDVVMDALHALPQDQRSARRQALAEEVGCSWLSRQGTGAGFVLVPGGGKSVVSGYRTVRLERERRGVSGQLGVIDFEGVLEVVDPVAFLAAITKGFGRAKAFGCGLMLIRRSGLPRGE
jgi:CRISPR system Cascade subunit CasE